MQVLQRLGQLDLPVNRAVLRMRGGVKPLRVDVVAGGGVGWRSAPLSR
jgi:hypothetical protein